MPYQAMATMGRRIAGILAPKMPNAPRANTGKGTRSRCPAVPVRLFTKYRISTPTAKAMITCQPEMPNTSRPIAMVYPPRLCQADIHQLNRFVVFQVPVADSGASSVLYSFAERGCLSDIEIL